MIITGYGFVSSRVLEEHMDDANEIGYVSGGIELLDDIAPLWVKLNQLHATVSPHFRPESQKRTFDERRQELIGKSACGRFRIDIARPKNRLGTIGYCVSTIDMERTGEIDSIYVEEAYRNLGVGSHLMNTALAWMESCDVAKKQVVAGFGNDAALGFYERFGFFPANFELIQKTPGW